MNLIPPLRWFNDDACADRFSVAAGLVADEAFIYKHTHTHTHTHTHAHAHVHAHNPGRDAGPNLPNKSLKKCQRNT